ncbi:MAG: DegT/DnrJ/EryC1/StrS family aminotransferase [Bdellovibrionota bacterium]
MSDWKAAVEKEWLKRASATKNESLFPLIAQSFDSREIISMVDTLLTGRLTMASRVREFEMAFAKYVGSPFAVMVNSGSSANLLAMAVLANPVRKRHLKPGDEVLVPAVCWSTSVWPIVQMGLKPVFVDVDPQTLNADLADLRKKVTPKTKGMVAVHILGNSAPMKDLMAFTREHDLLVLEDTCESLGSRANGKVLGTHGHFGSYSFYYSHHMTTGEGGMVTCQTQEDYDLLKCLRAHGWSRELSNRAEIERANPEVDPRFLFVNLGYNVRPMEVQAAFGVCQLERLDKMNATRVRNHEKLTAELKAHAKWRGQFEFPKASVGTDPVWFGFPALLAPGFGGPAAFLSYLSKQGVENRPIVSGNFARQPSLKLLGIDCDPKSLPGAERINQTGFFIGLHTEDLEPSMIRKLADILLGYDFA